MEKTAIASLSKRDFLSGIIVYVHACTFDSRHSQMSHESNLGTAFLGYRSMKKLGNPHIKTLGHI